LPKMTDSLIDDNILSCLFQPRYMIFDLCVRLENVSKPFLESAHRFYRQLEQFDFNDYLVKENRVKWANKIVKCCPNLKRISNLPVHKTSFDQDALNFQFVGKLPSVSFLSINATHFSPIVVLSLTDMEKLASVEFLREIDTFGSQPFVAPCTLNMCKTLNITRLTCPHLNYVSFCDPDQLRIFHLCFGGKIRIPTDKLVGTLKKLHNLTDLTVSLCDQSTKSLLDLIDFVSNAPQLERFSLRLFYHLAFSELKELVKHQCFRECVHHLQLVKIGDSLKEIEACIESLPELKSLVLNCVACQHDIPLDLLPKLESILIISCVSKNCPEFEAKCFLKTSYTGYVHNAT